MKSVTERLQWANRLLHFCWDHRVSTSEPAWLELSITCTPQSKNDVKLLWVCELIWPSQPSHLKEVEWDVVEWILNVLGADRCFRDATSEHGCRWKQSHCSGIKICMVCLQKIFIATLINIWCREKPPRAAGRQMFCSPLCYSTHFSFSCFCWVCSFDVWGSCASVSVLWVMFSDLIVLE